MTTIGSSPEGGVNVTDLYALMLDMAEKQEQQAEKQEQQATEIGKLKDQIQSIKFNTTLRQIANDVDQDLATTLVERHPRLSTQKEKSRLYMISKAQAEKENAR
jgi:hypothetical protein